MHYLILLVACLFSIPVHAQVSYTLTDASLVARINGKPFTRNAMNTLHTVAARKDLRIPFSKVMASVIDNRLISDYARKQFPDAKLLPNVRVAYRPEVAIEDQLVATLRRAYQNDLDDFLSREKGGNLQGTITRPFQIDKNNLTRLLGPQATLAVELTLSREQQAKASQLKLLSYRFGKQAEQHISLRDVYQRLNVQGRTLIHSYDIPHLEQQTLQLLATRYTLYWAEASGKLSRTDLAVLKDCMADRLYRGGYLQLTGLEADMHYDSSYLKALAQQVTTAEIQTYYESHRNEFKRIERVKARHIRTASEAEAKTLQAQLDKGTDFSLLAQSHSRANDASSGGDLGWIQHQDAQANWLNQVAFALSAGKVSRPIRTPAPPGQQADWEIILVEQKIEGFQPADSESVRYLASQAIARKKAIEQFRSLRQQLYASARIELNKNDFTDELNLQ